MARPPYVIRLSAEERDLVARAARHRAIAMSAYVRQAAVLAARRDLADSVPAEPNVR